MGVERAVSARAGIRVMASVAPGHGVHPGFLLFTAFVGANLFPSASASACPAITAFRRLGLRQTAAPVRP